MEYFEGIAELEPFSLKAPIQNERRISSCSSVVGRFPADCAISLAVCLLRS